MAGTSTPSTPIAGSFSDGRWARTVLCLPSAPAMACRTPSRAWHSLIVPTAPPAAPGSLLLGNTLALQRDQLGTYARAMAEQGDIARFRVGPPGIGFSFDAVFSPEGARQVLAADASPYVKDAPVIGEFRHFLGNGLLVSEGERWRRDRRIAAPLFTRRAVSGRQACPAGAGRPSVATARCLPPCPQTASPRAALYRTCVRLPKPRGAPRNSPAGKVR